MNKIRLIYTATAGIATPLLQKLASDERFEVLLVVTQEDRPAGRKMELKPSPVKQVAEELKLPVFQPKSISDPESVKRLRSLEPDLMVVLAYGQIMNLNVLKLPKHGCVNVHISLLPKYRGASPVQSALLAGDEITGVSVMRMDEKMDTGPVFKSFTIPIGSADNSITLHEKLSHLSASEAPDILVKIAQESLEPTPQDDSIASYCQKIQKSDGRIDWNEDAEVILRKIRAYAGWPGSFTIWDGKILKILKAHAIKNQESRIKNQEPGTVTELDGEILISTKNGFITPTTVQLEGKKAMKIGEFVRGNPNFIESSLT